MKKNLFWMAAAIVSCGLAFTACAVDDLPVPPGPEDHFIKTSSTFDFEDDETPFINDSRMATVGVGTVEGWDSKVATFIGAGNAQNGYSFAHYNFSEKVEKAAISIVSFDMYNNQGSRSIVTIGDGLIRGNGVGAGCLAKMIYGAKGGIFRIGSDKNNAFINGTIYPQADLCNKWLKVEVKVYNFDRQVEWTVMEGEEIIAQSGVTEGEGEEAVFVPGKEEFWQADANEGTQIDVFGCINSSTNTYIDNLTITGAVDPSVKFTDAKIIYVDPEGNEIKDAREVKDVRVGSFISLLESDKAPIYNAENTIKWVYDSDNAAETPVAENSVVTIKFKDSGKYAWRLRQYFNDGQGANGTRIGTEWIEGEQFVGDTYQVYYKCAYKHPTDGKWYVAPIGSAGYQDRSYTFTGNESTNAQGIIHLMDVKYEKVDSIVWIGEFEDQTAMTLVGEVTTWIGWTDLVQAPGNRFARFSNGAGARLTEASYFVINDAFEGGNYKIFIHGRNGNSEGVAEAPALYYIPAGGGDPVKIDIEIPTTAGGIMMSVTLENVAIPAGAKLVIKNDGNATDLDLDLISICKQPVAVAE